MATYAAPLKDIQLAMQIAGLKTVAALPGYEEATDDLIAAVLEEAGRLGAQELAPLNKDSDSFGVKLDNGAVTVHPALKDFYTQQYLEGGWNALPFSPDYGGQGLPWLVAAAVQEIWQSANMAFGLCPMLNQGAVDLLTEHGSDEQKALYLPKMISGEWTGTMNLTEPQAGSDLSQVKTRAVRDGDHYRITGTKIFITYGDHDLTDNIIHMVLARLPDAPEGVKGISLFIVPKVLVNADGSLGARNDVVCASLEHKLGIHASPTAVMSFGETDGAIGYLVGEENKGLAYMFTMMNNARLNVGLQGYAVAERATQHAVSYAKERIQSRPVVGAFSGGAPIINHPDVRRMLISMKAQVQAARLLTYTAIATLDVSIKAADAETASRAANRVALLTPLVKLWGTEIGVSVASEGVQVFGGMGFIEETGAAQFYRDARIAPIYEGTNGIQAADFVGRKVQKDKGAELLALVADLRAGLTGLDAGLTAALNAALDRVERTAAFITAAAPADAYAASVPFSRLAAMAVGGCLLLQAADAAKADSDPLYAQEKQVVAQYFIRHLLPQTAALEAEVLAGGDAVMALPVDAF
ncbi:acyl-CoA dehydrogenase [Novispirillum itersonii]|uniref:3-methylmercaptopropionyl-CoA dehydrogenase n=1 Tax=Novispirillum itersonii TaxID=189 RepID=A0A7W9ZKI5_NOVIT|nr:acyl-CoA dehydrogenase [Novispirillum itersonii]MBB6211899.1 alkylation response protein AidB-like acyl-CoA dehydrogenase [Novispirillum itersonii]